MGDSRGSTAESREVVAVCGAGAAGMAAALAAARAGAKVCLIEAKSDPGGTVTDALIHTLGGFYDSAGELLNGGLARELVQALASADPAVHRRRLGRTWVLNVCPHLYQTVVGRWIEAEARITAYYEARATQLVKTGDRISELKVSGPGGSRWLRVKAVIDATGTAELVRLLEPSLLDSDPQRAAGGLIFTLRGVAPGTAVFPKGVGVLRALRGAAANGTLPADCRNAWIDMGTFDDEVYVKLFVSLPEDWRDRESRGEITREALKTQAAVVSFLQRLPGFAQARVSRTGGLGVRDGGRIRGEYCLTGSDVRQACKFADAACRCCWPIEYWDPDQGVSLEYLPNDTYYEVPLRALKVQGVRNLWAAGKCLSADRFAQASARVVGTCWSMGEAAGTAAAGL
jgi:hypothetical protein